MRKQWHPEWHLDYEGNVADYCWAQPCIDHGFTYYGGRKPGPWEWETQEDFEKRKAASFLKAVAEAYDAR